MNEYLDYLTQGKKIEIIIRTPRGALRFFCGFKCIKANLIITTLPKNKYITFNFPAGQALELYIYTKSGVFKLLCRLQKFNEELCVISLPENVKKIQRREYIRVNMKVRTTISLNTPTYSKTIRTNSRNISAKGINLLLDEDISKYAKKINLSLLFPECIIKTLAQVIKSTPVKTESGLYYDTSLMFITISEKEIDFIVKKCFEFEAAQRRKLLDKDI